MKRLLLASLVILAAALPVMVARDTARAAVAQPTKRVPGCINLELYISPQEGTGAAGHLAAIFRIHNLGQSTCSLFGYPGVRLLDRKFFTLPTTVVRGPGNLVGGEQPTLVLLAPSGNAYFALGYSDVPVGGRRCLAPARYLMVWAPNDVLPLVINAAHGGGSIVSCTGVINVTPVTSTPRYR